MDDMRAAFACQALTLSVGALPHLDPATLCPPPPPRRSATEPAATDIFSQSQGQEAMVNKYASKVTSV